MLKSIEFPGGVENSPPGGAADVAKPKSLEMLLMEKNRSLQTENTQMKLANNDVTGEGVGVWGGGCNRGVSVPVTSVAIIILCRYTGCMCVLFVWRFCHT